MTDQTSTQLLVFRLGEIVCAAGLDAVREITPTGPATRIPGAPPTVKGLANIRGSLVPVVDGGLVLVGSAATRQGSTIMLRVAGTVVGLAVDEVLDLVRQDAAGLTDRDELPGVDRRWVKAVGRHDGLMFALLDVDAVLGPLLPPEGDL